MALDEGLDVGDGPFGEEVGEDVAPELVQAVVNGGEHGFGNAGGAREWQMAIYLLGVAGVYLVVEGSVADMELVWVYTHDWALQIIRPYGEWDTNERLGDFFRTILIMHSFQFPHEFPIADDGVVEFI